MEKDCTSLNNLFELYLKSGLYLRGWSEKTAVIYKRAFTSFQKSLRQSTRVNASGEAVPEGNQQPGVEPGFTSGPPVTKAHLEAWIISRREAGMSPSGINIYIRAMNAFMAWLVEEKHIEAIAPLKQLKAPVKAITVFSEKDISLILSFKPRGFYELRTWVLLLFLLDTGCRIDEVINLRDIDVDMDNLLITVLGKGNKQRKVPFSVESRKVVFRYLQGKQRRILKSGLVFCCHNGSKLMYRNVMRDVRKLCKKVGITKHVRLHLTRHTFACHFMKNGGSIYTLSRILGHTSVSTTQIYIRGLGVEDFKEEHARLSPLVRR